MPTFTLYVALRADEPLDDVAVAAMATVVRPEDEEFCIWRDEYERTVVRVSTDCSAADLEAALDHGHALADETLGSSPVPASVEEIQAMTDDEALVWRAER